MTTAPASELYRRTDPVTGDGLTVELLDGRVALRFRIDDRDSTLLMLQAADVRALAAALLVAAEGAPA